MIASRCCTLALLVLAARVAAAEPKVQLVGLVPGDDLRHVLAIGPQGQVYEPDGHGAWIRHHAFGLAVEVTSVGRGAVGAIAGGDGAVFRLADNGWTAIRLTQHGKAIVTSGRRAIAAVGRDVFELDRGAEPTRLVRAPNDILALAAGSTGVVVQTSAGTFRIERGKLQPLANVPAHARLVSDRWADTGLAAVDLRTGVARSWPSLVVLVAGTADGGLVGLGALDKTVELVVIHPGGKLERQPIPLTFDGKPVPVALAMDAAGNVVIALGDGRLVVRDGKAWSIATIVDDVPAHPPGSPPAAQ